MSRTTGRNYERRAGTSAPSGLSRADLRGRAVGIAVLAWFALLWISWGTSAGVPDAARTPISVAAVVCFLACVGGAVLVYRRAAAAPAGHEAARDRAVGRRFGIVVAVEFVGLIVVVRILTGTGHGELVPTIVCLGVGIHFFPLSRLFGVLPYHRTGAALCLVALATAVVAPLTGLTALWTIVPGFGAGLALYSTSALLIRTGIRNTRFAR